VQGHQPGGHEFGRRLGQWEHHALVLGQGAAERPPIPDVLFGLGQGPVTPADRFRGVVELAEPDAELADGEAVVRVRCR
jgi:hypothetical protein